MDTPTATLLALLIFPELIFQTEVTSGVYLVYATNRNIANPSVAVAKIMIVR